MARLRFATMQLYRRMREESSLQTPITPSRFQSVSTIEARGPLRTTDLARIERLSKSSVTRIVGFLAYCGLDEMLPDEHDGRSALVGVTTDGKQPLAAASDHTHAFLANRIQNFSEAERDSRDLRHPARAALGVGSEPAPSRRAPGGPGRRRAVNLARSS